MVYIMLYGTNNAVWYIKCCVVQLMLCGTYNVVWYIYCCMVHILLYGTYLCFYYMRLYRFVCADLTFDWVKGTSAKIILLTTTFKINLT